MESRYKLLGHPIHAILIPYPLALLSTAAVFDVVGLLIGDGTWHAAAYLMIAAGVLVGLAAGLFGALDWLGVPRETRARSVGFSHGSGNVVVLVIFIVSWLLRTGRVEDPGLVPVALAVVGAGILGVTGWLGGELPYRLRIGIDEGAHPDAPSSLSGEPIVRAEPRGS